LRLPDHTPVDIFEVLQKAADSLEDAPGESAARLDASTSVENKLETTRALCLAAMQRVMESASLLENALGLGDVDALAFRETFEQLAFGDGCLERAARRGLKLVDLERAYVHAVLRVVGGNKSEAARRLGINRRTLQRRLGEDDEIDADDDDADEGTSQS
jgi:DNA-binding protein Fis